MSWQALVVLLVLLVMLTIVGFGVGVGQPRLPKGKLPDPPGWLRDVGAAFDRSRPLRPGEITGCSLDGRTLRLDVGQPEVTCEVPEVESGTREAHLRLERGRAVVRAHIRGEQAAKVEVKLPGEDDVREGSLRIREAGASLTVRCKKLPCELVFGEPEDP